jgi:hypothetical protein
MVRAKGVAIGLGLVLGLTVPLLGQTTPKGQSSTSASPKAAKAEKYRELTPKDGLSCGARVASMGFTFFGTPSGELDGFECLNEEGKTTSIKLKSKEFTDGKIETQDFGIIVMRRATMEEVAKGRSSSLEFCTFGIG